MGLDYRVECCPDGLMTDRRHNVRVLDCTIRDGGCCNGWQFDDSLVRDTFEALVAAGVDVMEIGYQTSPGVYDRAKVGPWRFCDEDALERVARETSMKLSTMLDIGRARPEDLRPASDSLVDVIRVATYAADIDQAIAILEHADSLGYETFCNVMAVSSCTPQKVDAFLGKLRASKVGNVAVVDSYGAMYPHHIRYLIRKYKNWLRPDQGVGVHFHNNQVCAFANSIAAIEEGADIVDATLFGMGRGAGNCPLESLLMYLDDPGYDVRPLFPLMPRYAELRDALRWGYHPPYAITGWLNRHPRAAIQKMGDDEHRYDVLPFYEELTKDRPRNLHHMPVTEDAAK